MIGQAAEGDSTAAAFRTALDSVFASPAYRWAEMPAQITDEMLAAFVLEGSGRGLGPKLRARYTGLLDRVGLYRPFTTARMEDWDRLAKGIREE